MADTVVVERVVVGKRRYRWPEIMLSIVLFLLLVCSSVVLGAFSYITYVQKRLWVGIPWYYYFLISIAVITIVFIFLVIFLYYIHLLLPIVVLIMSFILFVLWLTGLIKSSIELWGPLGSINDQCVRYVYRNDGWGGLSLSTLARIQQEGICNLWKTSFAMEMIATFLFLWMMIMSYQVMTGR